MTAAGPPILPAFVAAASTGPDRARTLVLRQESGGQHAGSLSYAILRAADPVPGEPELAETAASRNALESVVASLPAAGTGDAGDTGQALSQFGIGYILLPDPTDQALASQLNAAAGLQPLTTSSSYDLWQVSGPVARVRVVTPTGTAVPVPSGPVGVNTTLAPGTSGTLVLAEAAGGWSATLDGKPLTRLAAPVDGWAQGFTLPAGGGHLVITRNETARNLSLGVEALALLAVFVLALPGSRASVPAPVVPRAEGARGHSAPEAAAAPAAGRRRARAAGAEQHSTAGVQGDRRKRRPQVALAGVTAGRGARAEEADGAEEGDDIGAGYPVATGAATPDPFGTHGDPGYGAGTGYQTDPGYGTDPGSRTPEPALGVTPDLDEDPAPWAGLAPKIPQTPALRDRPDPAPAAPRRGRGQHAARHGKPSRRSRGDS